MSKLSSLITDLFAVPLFLALTAIIFSTALRVSRFATRTCSFPLDLATIIIASSFILVLEVILGSAQLLTRNALILGVLVSCVIVRALVPQQRGLAVCRFHPGRDRSRWHRLIPGIAVIGFCCGSILFQAGVKWWEGPAGWDVWTYHLTFPADWLHSANLRTIMQHYGDSAPPFYPLNAGLWAFWTMIFISSDLIAKYIQLPFLIAAMVGIYRAARILGLTREYALFGAGAFVTLPLAVGMTSSAYNDVVMAGTFALSLAAFCVTLTAFSPFAVVMTGLSVGMFLGVKYSALPFAVTIMVPTMLIILKRGANRIRLLGIFLGGIVSTGGFTYIRNFIITGDPIYPANLELLGMVLFPGAFSSSIFNHTGLHKADLARLLFSSSGLREVGWQTPALLVTAAVLAPLLGLLSKHRKATNWALALPLALFLLYYFIVPYRYSARFFFPALVAASLNLAFLASRFERCRGGRWLSLVVWLTPLAVWFNTYELVPHARLLLTVSFLLAIGCWLLIKAGWCERIRNGLIRRKRLLLSLCIIGLGITGPLGHWMLATYSENKWDYVEGDLAGVLQWLYQVSVGRPLSIAHAGNNAPYPYYGRRLQNSVQFIARNQQFASTYYGFEYPFADMQAGMTFEAWHQNITRAEVDYLITTSHHGSVFPPEDEWARRAGFPLAFVNKTFHIFAVATWTQELVL